MTPVDPLLKAKEVAAALNISVASLYRRMADGTVSKPLKLGGTSRWPKSDILAVIEAAKSRRDAA